jgi:hypothetical protein
LVQWRFRSNRYYSYTPPATTAQPAAAQPTPAAPNTAAVAAPSVAQTAAAPAPPVAQPAPPPVAQPAAPALPYNGQYQANYPSAQPGQLYWNGYAEPYYVHPSYYPPQGPATYGYTEPYYSQPMNPGPAGGYPTSNPNGNGGRTWYQFYGGDGYWY